MVELLVVVAILVLLAGLLFPALAGAKRKAHLMQCQNNLGQIGKALALYVADFHKYPGTRYAPRPVPRETPTNWVEWEMIWDWRLRPYLSGNAKVFLCPALRPSFTTLLLTNYSYGYNACGTGFPKFQTNLGLGRSRPQDMDPTETIQIINESQVVSPADMIAVGDLNDIAGAFMVTLGPPFDQPRLAEVAAPARRHDNGANTVFCDGHVEYGKTDKWNEASDTARRRWNNDHEPHRETWQ